MKRIVLLFPLLGLLFLFSSCEKEERKDQSFYFDELRKFSESNPELFQSISWEYEQTTEDFFTVPVIKDEVVQYRIVITRGELLVLDFSNWKQQVGIKIGNSDYNSIEIPMIYNEESDLYEPNLSALTRASVGNLEACVAACTLSAIYMGLGDGPLPLADIAALMYLTWCITECNNAHGYTA